MGSTKPTGKLLATPGINLDPAARAEVGRGIATDKEVFELESLGWNIVKFAKRGSIAKIWYEESPYENLQIKIAELIKQGKIKDEDFKVLESEDVIYLCIAPEPDPPSLWRKGAAMVRGGLS